MTETIAGAAVAGPLAQELASWLDDPSLARRAAEHLTAGRRLAQEAIGPVELREVPDWLLGQ